MKKTDMAQILTYIMSDFGGELSQDKVAVWYDQCKHLDAAFAMECARKLMAQKHFGPPRVADYLEVIDDMSKTPEEKMLWSEAWEVAIGLVKKYGLGKPSAAALEIKDNPKLIAVIRQVGWRDLCMTDYKEHGFLKARFKDIWEQNTARDAREKQLHGQIGAPDLKQLVSGIADAKKLPGA